jgi:hypothetical protein
MILLASSSKTLKVSIYVFGFSCLSLAEEILPLRLLLWPYSSITTGIDLTVSKNN